MVEFLAWVASRRTYAEAMEAWRSNCPRYSVWEDALADGLIRVVESGGTLNESEVTLTAKGRAAQRRLDIARALSDSNDTS